VSMEPRDLPGIPHDSAGPVFKEPWEAKAFAMVLRLHERGLFSWVEWAAALSDEIGAARAAGEAGSGDTYYRHWLQALETMVARKGAARGEELAASRHAWALAAARTPHGSPIELRPEDLRAPRTQ